MLRVNTTVRTLVLEQPPLDIAVRDERLIESLNQLHIEQQLNNVGPRGRLLASDQTTREQWVLDTLDELCSNVGQRLTLPLSVSVACIACSD